MENSVKPVVSEILISYSQHLTTHTCIHMCTLFRFHIVMQFVQVVSAPSDPPRINVVVPKRSSSLQLSTLRN